MITYYTKKDMVSFGKYLLSQERKDKFRIADNDHRTIEEKLAEVYHADFENWKEKEQVRALKENQACALAGD